jgi:hypothetical protein
MTADDDEDESDDDTDEAEKAELSELALFDRVLDKHGLSLDLGEAGAEEDADADGLNFNFDSSRDPIAELTTTGDDEEDD